MGAISDPVHRLRRAAKFVDRPRTQLGQLGQLAGGGTALLYSWQLGFSGYAWFFALNLDPTYEHF